MPTWPAGLPQSFAADGYRELPPQGAVEHEMDAGPNKSFGAGAGGPRLHEGLLHLTAAQVEILTVFFRADLRDGELTFDWVDPRSAAAETFLLLQAPVYTHIGGDRWTAALVMETRPSRALLSGQSITTSRGTGSLAIGATFTGISRSGSLGDGALS